MASVLRTLSKRTGHGEKSRLNASRSLDEDIRTVKRPTSRDRPTLMNAFTPKQPSPSLESILGSPAASNSASTTPVVTPAPAVRKKKRRSSLSDLKMARDPEVTEARSSADKRGSVLVSSVKTPQRLPELTKMSPFTFPKVLEDADYSPNQTPVRRGSSTLSELSVKLQDSPQTPSPPKRDLAPRERRERKESVSSTISSLSVEPRERKERKGSVSAEKRPTTSGSQTSTSSRSKIGSTRRVRLI